MRTLTWFELSRVADGDRVVFTTSWDIPTVVVVPEGTTATVVENGLNEIWSSMLLKTDNEAVTKALAKWDGMVELAPINMGYDWSDLTPVALEESK